MHDTSPRPHIVVYEHDPAHIRRLNSAIYAAFDIRPVVHSTPAPIERIIQQPHQPTIFLLDIVSEHYADAGHRLAESVYTTAPEDAVIFVTERQDKYLNQPFAQRHSVGVVFKQSETFTAELELHIRLALREIHTRRTLTVGRTLTALIPHREITFMETGPRKNHVLIHQTTGAAVECYSTLTAMLSRLGNPHFVQVHASYVANFHNVRQINRAESKLVFSDGTSCYYAQSFSVAQELRHFPWVID